MSKQKLALLWLHNDFRLADNLALSKAVEFEKLLPIYIWDETSFGAWSPGGASKWWLHTTLEKFQIKLKSLGSDLLILKGDTKAELTKIIDELQPDALLWNNPYEPATKKIVHTVINQFNREKIAVYSFQGNILKPFNELLKKDGSPYLVYTAFWNNYLKLHEGSQIPPPMKLPSLPDYTCDSSVSVHELNLLSHTGWHKKLEKHWQVGEDIALKNLQHFLGQGLANYGQDRDIPSVRGTSLFSPYLHFGEIHPLRILYEVERIYGQLAKISDNNIKQFCKEILWREFSYHHLEHFPHTITKPLRETFNHYPWKRNKRHYQAWCKGETGYPIVDAGMRQLWETGWMHNRVRMIVASFLVKHLGIPWQQGAEWFWDTLVDADLASNTQGWQWTAGCGADAAPFFRIFNPITQGEKFDKDGKYVAHWCPELAQLPRDWIHQPFNAPTSILQKANVTLGHSYPFPIVDHKEARNKALWNYEWMKKQV